MGRTIQQINKIWQAGKKTHVITIKKSTMDVIELKNGDILLITIEKIISPQKLHKPKRSKESFPPLNEEVNSPKKINKNKEKIRTSEVKRKWQKQIKTQQKHSD